MFKINKVNFIVNFEHISCLFLKLLLMTWEHKTKFVKETPNTPP